MDRRKALLVLLTTVVLWSSSALFVKFLDGHPLAVTGIRSTVAAVVIYTHIQGTNA